jgi:repressor LexA
MGGDTMTIGEKVKQAREAKGMTQEELAHALGYKSRTSVNKIETGERDVPRRQIKKIAQILGVPPVSLLGWEDDPLPKVGALVGREKPKPRASRALDLIPQAQIYNVPIFESVSAGFGACANDCIVGYMPLFITSPEEAAETLIVRVRGDSMYPRINDGDLIQVHRQDYADNGQTVVMLIDGEEAVVKRYFCDAEHEEVRLESFNAAYAPRVFRGKDIERLRVLGVARRVIADL